MILSSSESLLKAAIILVWISFHFFFRKQVFAGRRERILPSVEIPIEIDDVKEANMCEKRNDSEDLFTHRLNTGKKRKMGWRRRWRKKKLWKCFWIRFHLDGYEKNVTFWISCRLFLGSKRNFFPGSWRRLKKQGWKNQWKNQKE